MVWDQLQKYGLPRSSGSKCCRQACRGNRASVRRTERRRRRLRRQSGYSSRTTLGRIPFRHPDPAVRRGGRAADRLRQCRESACRTGCVQREGDRSSPRSRRNPRSTDGAVAHRIRRACHPRRRTRLGRRCLGCRASRQAEPSRLARRREDCRRRAYDASAGPVTQFAKLNSVGVDYFRTLQIPLRTGRVFTAGDLTGESPNVVIVNEILAGAFFPQGAVGQPIGVPPLCRDTKCDFIWATIVGVVGDAKPGRSILRLCRKSTCCSRPV